MNVREEEKARLWQEVGNKGEIEIMPPSPCPGCSTAGRDLRVPWSCAACASGSLRPWAQF